MRILSVCADRGVPPDGTKGASIHFRCLSAALRDAGHDVAALAARRSRSDTPFPVPLGHGATESDILEWAARNGRPDVVYERYSLGATGALAASRALGVPFGLEVNAPLVREARLHRPHSVCDEDADTEQRLLRAADLVVTVSAPLRAWVAEVRGGSEGTALVPNGFDPAPYAEPRGRSVPRGATVAFLGHPKPWHGAGRLAGLVATLVAQDVDAQLVVIGGGPGADDVLADAERLHVRSRVRVTGPVGPDAIAAELSRAAVAVAPYPRHDLFYFCPLKVIESLGAGLPVVSTRQGDLPDIVGDAGILVDPSDDAAFAAATRTLLLDRHLRDRLAVAARRRATRFTWERTAARLTDLLSRLHTPSAPVR